MYLISTLIQRTSLGALTPSCIAGDGILTGQALMIWQSWSLILYRFGMCQKDVFIPMLAPTFEREPSLLPASRGQSRWSRIVSGAGSLNLRLSAVRLGVLEDKVRRTKELIRYCLHEGQSCWYIGDFRVERPWWDCLCDLWVMETTDNRCKHDARFYERKTRREQRLWSTSVISPT